MSWDTVIIGGGPGGSSAAAVLAGKGRRVVVLEREKFPRYHIGESLIPFTYFPLQRIGMIDRMKASAFPNKHSVQFISMDGRASQPFYFFRHLQHEASCTWQVWRSEFDQMLLDNAREHGAEVREQTTARGLIEEDGRVVGVRAEGPDGEALEFRAPITIDASGRDAFTLSRKGWKKRDPQLDKVALWTYYKGAMRDPGIDEGATTVAFVPERGWFWYIPLSRDIVSVGIVAEKDYLFGETRDHEAIFQREIGRNVWIQQHLAPGTRCEPFRVTGEYSYRSAYCAADGLVLVGDAFAFLDPVFSSGVFLALRGGEMAADAVDAALRDGDVSAARFTEYGDEYRKGLEGMRRLVYAFYDHEFSFRALFKQYPDVHGDLTDCLIGNLQRDFDPLFTAVSQFAKVPAPLDYGRPLVAPDTAA